MPSLSELEARYNAFHGKEVHYLAGLQDSGPGEPDLNKIIDADLGEICKHYKRRRPARARRVRAYRLGGGY